MLAIDDFPDSFLGEEHFALERTTYGTCGRGVSRCHSGYDTSFRIDCLPSMGEDNRMF
jgi:hypothetical protein